MSLRAIACEQLLLTVVVFLFFFFFSLIRITHTFHAYSSTKHSINVLHPLDAHAQNRRMDGGFERMEYHLEVDPG